MKIAIIGAGALGGLLGFHLSGVAEVVFVDGWAAHVAAINAGGIVCERAGETAARRVRATANPVEAGPADLAIVLVKARETAWAATAAAAALTPAGVAFTLQNGVGNRELLAAALGERRAGQGVTSMGAMLLGPGRVREAGPGPTLLGAEPDRRAAEELAGLLRACGLEAAVSADIDGVVWGKLLVNVGINALAALLRVPNGALAELPVARELLRAAVEEAAAVALARGTALQGDPVERALAVVQATPGNRSSMLQDVLRGAPSEIGVINGAVVREGARLGVPTPINATLTALVEALDASADLRVG